MFASVVLEIEPRGRVDFIGDHLHGWFIGELARHNQALADRVHAGTSGKPFSLWAGHRFTLDVSGVSRDETDPVHWLRLTSVIPELTAFLTTLAAEPPTTIDLGSSRFDVRRTLARREDHRWTGTARPDEMWARWMTSASLPRGRVSLTFLSPTSFSKGQHSTTLLPVAPLVFRSLVTTWNKNVTPRIDDETSAALLDAVQEESHDLHTVPPLRFASHQLKGFVGVCEYSCGSKASDASRRLLHLLADFAFFAAVGLKRTMGMGQVVGESV